MRWGWGCRRYSWSGKLILLCLAVYVFRGGRIGVLISMFLRGLWRAMLNIGNS